MDSRSLDRNVTDKSPHSNAMQVKFAEELRPTLQEYNPVLQIQSAFLPEKDILER